METKKYDRNKAVEYAIFWGLNSNPDYFNFDLLGGDCTNFVSQCVYSGAPKMNFTPVTGWFYNSLNSRAPAWTGVKELANFLLNNKSYGPFAKTVSIYEVESGDVVQLRNARGVYFHTAIVSQLINGKILVCSHTRNAVNLPLERFNFEEVRYLKILGYRV